MRNYIIGFSIFIIVIFILALAIGQADDTVDDIEYPDQFLTNVKSVKEPTIDSPDKSDVLTIEEPVDEVHADVDSEAYIPSQSIDSTAIDIPRTIRASSEQILNRIGYTTSYNKNTKCPNWVAWHLTKEHTDGPYHRSGVPYLDNRGNAIGISPFNPEIVRGDYIIDLQASNPRQEHTDWMEHPSNIEHGHMCPAADCKWSKEVINQSFLLTNMCPQDGNLNGGDWEELESRCRGWARQYGDIYIVAGPIFENGVSKTMGKNKIGIPDAFFKVVLRLGKNPKALGFIYPNNGTHHAMKEYVYSVDEVEGITGFDFFHRLPDEMENEIEKTSNIKEW